MSTDTAWATKATQRYFKLTSKNNFWFVKMTIKICNDPNPFFKDTSINSYVKHTENWRVWLKTLESL